MCSILFALMTFSEAKNFKQFCQLGRGFLLFSTVIYCWMAAVVRISNDDVIDGDDVEEMLCTATLVNHDLVVTSAECAQQ